MWTWLLLLALVVFVLYWWGVRPQMAKAAPGCNACAKRQNVLPVE